MISPGRGKNKKYLKPPPRNDWNNPWITKSFRYLNWDTPSRTFRVLAILNQFFVEGKGGAGGSGICCFPPPCGASPVVAPVRSEKKKPPDLIVFKTVSNKQRNWKKKWVILVLEMVYLHIYIYTYIMYIYIYLYLRIYIYICVDSYIVKVKNGFPSLKHMHKLHIYRTHLVPRLFLNPQIIYHKFLH